MKAMYSLYIVLICMLLYTKNTRSQSISSGEDINNSEFSYFVSGKLNGKDFILGQRASDPSIHFQLVTSSPLTDALCVFSDEDGADAKISYSTTIYPSFDAEDTQSAFAFYFERFNPCAHQQDFNSLFPIGKYSYAYDDQAVGTMKEMGIGFFPKASGDEFYHSYEKDQSKSTFKITASKTLNSVYGAAQSIEGEFSVTLYSDDDSEPIKITNGRFKIPVAN